MEAFDLAALESTTLLREFDQPPLDVLLDQLLDAVCALEEQPLVEHRDPAGVAVIGVVTLLLSEGYRPRVAVVSGVYIFIGLRMGLGALEMWRRGKLKVEFPRYEYQKLIYSGLDQLRRYDLPIYVPVPWKQTEDRMELLDIVLRHDIDYARAHLPAQVREREAAVLGPR